MTGLDKIIENIGAEARAKAQSIIEAAQEEAKQLLDEASNEASGECEEIVDSARGQVELTEKISQSNSELNGRKMMLRTRREILDGIMAEAVERLKKLPDGEYFAVLEKLAVKYAESGSGEIIFSKRDKARVPAGFIASVNAKLPNGSLTIAEDTVETDGGFVLRYGGIEENCTFDALAAQERERLSDELSRLLF